MSRELDFQSQQSQFSQSVDSIMENPVTSIQLRDVIAAYFNWDELQDLCWNLGVDFEELPNIRGEKSKNVEALIKILGENKLPELIKLCRERRPHINWPDKPIKVYFEEDVQTEAQRQEVIKKYKEEIQKETQNDNLLQGFTLNQLYIHLKGQEAAEEKQKVDDSAPQAGNNLLPESPSNPSESDTSVQPPQDEKEPSIVPIQPLPLDLQEAVEKHPRLIVLGAAGTGKSTFLRYLAHNKAKDGSDTIPILLRLSKFADALTIAQTKNETLEFKKWALEKASRSITDAEAVLEKEITAGHVLWLLDGFDEAIQKVKNPEDFTNLIARSIVDQQFVLTTRPDEVVLKRLPRFNDTAQYEMRDLNHSDIKQFLQKWFGEQEKIVEVLEWLALDPHRQRLITKPLHLVLLAIITKTTSQDNYPETRVQLYEKFLDDFLEKRIEDQCGGKGTDAFRLGNLEGTVAQAAALRGFHYLGWVLFHQENKLNNKRETVKEQVVTHLQKEGGYSNDDDADAIFLFWNSAGVQDSFHLSFWPYATACKLCDDWQTDAENTWRFLSSATRDLPYASRLHHPAWQEPILMMAAVMNEQIVNNFIDHLLRNRSKEERYLQQSFRLAASIIGEVGAGKFKTEYVNRIINHLGKIPKNQAWMRAFIQLSIYTVAIVSLYLFLPLWAFGSITFIGIYGILMYSSVFEDDSPSSDLFKIMGPFWVSLMNVFITLMAPIETILSLPLILLRWQAIQATKKNYLPHYQPPPEYIWEHWLVKRILLIISCVLVVFVFYQFFPIWLWKIILLFWLFDIVNWAVNRFNASSLLFQLFSLIGKGIGQFSRYLSLLLINVFKPSTFNANANSNALAELGAPTIPQLKQMLNSSSNNIRQAAIRALGQTQSSEATQVLFQPLIYGNELEQDLAIEALVNIGDASSIPALVFVWENESQNHQRRKSIIQALMKIDKTVSLPIIANMVGGYDQSYDILNAPEFIQNYAPPTFSSSQLSLEERVWKVHDKLSRIWNRPKNLPFLTLNNKDETYRNGPSSGTRGGVSL